MFTCQGVHCTDVISCWVVSCVIISFTEISCGIAQKLTFGVNTTIGRGPRWRSWLRHCATSQKVAGSIPDGVIGIFH